MRTFVYKVHQRLQLPNFSRRFSTTRDVMILVSEATWRTSDSHLPNIRSPFLRSMMAQLVALT